MKLPVSVPQKVASGFQVLWPSSLQADLPQGCAYHLLAYFWKSSLNRRSCRPLCWTKFGFFINLGLLEKKSFETSISTSQLGLKTKASLSLHYQPSICWIPGVQTQLIYVEDKSVCHRDAGTLFSTLCGEKRKGTPTLPRSCFFVCGEAFLSVIS